MPNVSQLAKVRFKVISIINDQIVEKGKTVCIEPKKTRHDSDSEESDSDIDSQMSDY